MPGPNNSPAGPDWTKIGVIAVLAIGFFLILLGAIKAALAIAGVTL